MLGDKAYDSVELRQDLHERGTKPVIPNRCNRKLQQAYLQAALAHRERVQQIEGLQAHRNPLRQAGAKLSGLCLPRRCSCMVDLMSLDPSLSRRVSKNGLPATASAGMRCCVMVSNAASISRSVLARKTCIARFKWRAASWISSSCLSDAGKLGFSGIPTVLACGTRSRNSPRRLGSNPCWKAAIKCDVSSRDWALR